MTVTPSDQTTMSGQRIIWFPHWLRALSVLVVVATHFTINFWAMNRKSAELVHVDPLPRHVLWDAGPLLRIADFNSFAVGFFFLISGFVIPLTLQGRSVRAFIVNRAFRVYPVWLANLVLIAVIWIITSSVLDRSIGVPVATWVANAFAVPDLAHVPTLDPPGWTLLVEVKFYAFCVVCAVTVGLARAWFIGGVAAALAMYAGMAWQNLTALAVASPKMWIVAQVIAWDAPYLCMILTGVCLFNRLRNGWSVVRTAACMTVCVAAMSASLWFIDEGGAAERVGKFIGYSLSITIFTAAFRWRDRVPPNRLIQRLADMSYSIYAVHFVLGLTLIDAFFRATGQPVLATLGAAMVVAVVSLLMHHLVERPAIRISHRRARERVRSAAVA